ncbi:MAG TPA: (deoxy)nucleoside triphosphate pyrophosphohydrolase [Candidatus Limnocylindrales bacterium]|nr:(deoxy)nucleoside triphosphate pyrophosphohydrolase [Candidatus Limnocylindrales bacterium]
MITVVAAIIERDSRILICQRHRDLRFPLKWEFPGGKVEPGESLQTALARELKEELGVDAVVGREIYRTSYLYPGRPEPIQLVFFLTKIGEIQVGQSPIDARPQNILTTSLIDKAFEQVKWVSSADLVNYDFLEANARLIAGLANGSLFSGNEE